MNRRGFLRMLGTGAAIGGVAAVAPSQVWPFRKIFLPLRPTLQQLMDQHMAAMMEVLPGHLTGTYPALYGSVLYDRPDAVRLENIQVPNLEPGQYLALDRRRYTLTRAAAAQQALIAQMDSDQKWFWKQPLAAQRAGFIEVDTDPMFSKPRVLAKNAARKFVDSLKVRNEDLGWDG
jgi:hypothetical protein